MKSIVMCIMFAVKGRLSASTRCQSVRVLCLACEYASVCVCVCVCAIMCVLASWTRDTRRQTV